MPVFVVGNSETGPQIGSVFKDWAAYLGIRDANRVAREKNQILRNQEQQKVMSEQTALQRAARQQEERMKNYEIALGVPQQGAELQGPPTNSAGLGQPIGYEQVMPTMDQRNAAVASLYGGAAPKDVNNVNNALSGRFDYLREEDMLQQIQNTPDLSDYERMIWQQNVNTGNNLNDIYASGNNRIWRQNDPSAPMQTINALDDMTATEKEMRARQNMSPEDQKVFDTMMAHKGGVSLEGAMPGFEGKVHDMVYQAAKQAGGRVLQFLVEPDPRGGLTRDEQGNFKFNEGALLKMAIVHRSPETAVNAYSSLAGDDEMKKAVAAYKSLVDHVQARLRVESGAVISATETSDMMTRLLPTSLNDFAATQSMEALMSWLSSPIIRNRRRGYYEGMEEGPDRAAKMARDVEHHIMYGYYPEGPLSGAQDETPNTNNRITPEGFWSE